MAVTYNELPSDPRARFVGNVDLDEKDEPLLKESHRRFVLFPIQFHEVRTRSVSTPGVEYSLFS